MRACLRPRGVLSSEVGTFLTEDGERSALVGQRYVLGMSLAR